MRFSFYPTLPAGPTPERKHQRGADWPCWAIGRHPADSRASGPGRLHVSERESRSSGILVVDHAPGDWVPTTDTRRRAQALALRARRHGKKIDKSDKTAAVGLRRYASLGRAHRGLLQDIRRRLSALPRRNGSAIGSSRRQATSEAGMNQRNTKGDHANEARPR
jgi:hypothetical protein